MQESRSSRIAFHRATDPPGTAVLDVRRPVWSDGPDQDARVERPEKKDFYWLDMNDYFRKIKSVVGMIFAMNL